MEKPCASAAYMQAHGCQRCVACHTHFTALQTPTLEECEGRLPGHLHVHRQPALQPALTPLLTHLIREYS